MSDAVSSTADQPALDTEPPDVAILRDRRELPIVPAGGRAWAIAWPGTGSHLRAMHRLELDAGGETAALAHEAEAAAAIDETDAGSGEPLAELARGLGVGRVSARARPAIDADILQSGGDQRFIHGWSSGIGL